MVASDLSGFVCIESARAAPSRGLPTRPGFLSFILAPPGQIPRPRAPLCSSHDNVGQYGSFPFVELFSHRAVAAGNSDKWEGAVSNSSAAVAQYLPFLRRYARALTGSQA